MNVLSLFDGISCARVALDNLGVEVENYFSAEIDKYCIRVSEKRWPETIHLGDVTGVTADKLVGADGEKVRQIDLLIGGSPCTDLSKANEARAGLAGSRSKLFYEFIRVKKEINPTYFLFENVGMKPENQAKITELLGVEPIEMNSMYFTPQRRRRLFWTNVPGSGAVSDDRSAKKVGRVRQKLKSILQPEVELSGKDWKKEGGAKHLSLEHYNGILKNYTWQEADPEKPCGCLMASYFKQNPHGPYVACADSPSGYRMLTAIECERLQGLPDDYTRLGAGVNSRGKGRITSLSQRYKMLGNAFTVPVVEELLKGLKEE